MQIPEIPLSIEEEKGAGFFLARLINYEIRRKQNDYLAHFKLRQVFLYRGGLQNSGVPTYYCHDKVPYVCFHCGHVGTDLLVSCAICSHCNGTATASSLMSSHYRWINFLTYSESIQRYALEEFGRTARDHGVFWE